jgi:uncharacterized tellurite resistance protein B-like protein
VIQAIKRYFDKRLDAVSAESAGHLQRRLRLATSALLMEVARADDHVSDDELASLGRALKKTFGLSSAEIEELMRLGEQEAELATSYFQFTSLIKENFSFEMKTKVIEMLWQVAFADGRVDTYEEHFVRKIADLLYVPHRDFIAAKHRAERDVSARRHQ